MYISPVASAPGAAAAAAGPADGPDAAGAVPPPKGASAADSAAGGALDAAASSLIARAIEFRAPNHLAEFAYDVATEFNRFYEACHILSETDAGRQASWLRLVDVTLRVLLTLLDLLAIEVPERM